MKKVVTSVLSIIVVFSVGMVFIDCGDDPCTCPEEWECGQIFEEEWSDDILGVSCHQGCGSCSDGNICVDHKCVKCQPSCAGKQCGYDGCGGTCGGCADGERCWDDMCCTPDCTGKECGSDGCGSTCGYCDEEQTCNASGICE